MYPDEGIDMNKEGSSGGDDLAVPEGDAMAEPCEGMEFQSEEAAKIYYHNYACRVGFLVRVRSCHRSERGGKIIALRLGCNKEGYRDTSRYKSNPPKNVKPITRGGCKAMIYIKYISCKWIVSRFVKEHNHPLVVAPRLPLYPTDEKDRKIQELTSELQRKELLCAAYREQLNTFLKSIEEHNDRVTIKVQNVLNNLKEHETNA